MAEIDDANAFFEARGNRVWKALPNKAEALLDAGDYILANYKIKPTLTADEQVRFNTAKFKLALELAKSPAVLKATAAVKKTDDELGDMVSIVEYAEAPTDPYPMITALLAPLNISQSAKGIIIGTLSL